MDCKRSSFALLVCLALAGTLSAEQASSAGLSNPFYAMDTAFAPHFRKSALSLEQGLALVKELGYAGVGWLEKSPVAVKSDLAEIEKHGLKMYAIYSHAQVAPNGDLTVSKDALPVMKVLNGRCDIFWVHISGKGPAIKTLTGKEPLVAKLRSLADTAKASGLRIAVYPHLGDWAERFGDATRLAKLVDRPNFGVSFNLCHCLATGDEARIPALLDDARPVLFTATICGADSGVHAPDKALWKKLIQPLGQGTFDVGIVLGKLRQIGFPARSVFRDTASPPSRARSSLPRSRPGGNSRPLPSRTVWKGTNMRGETTLPTAGRENDMKRMVMAVGLVLAMACSAWSDATEWPPEREKESVFTGRKLEVFKHGIKKEWGYAAPQRDTFLVLHPKQARTARRSTSSCIPPDMTSTPAWPARPRSATTTSTVRPKISLRCISIAAPTTETGGGAATNTRARRSAPRTNG